MTDKMKTLIVVFTTTVALLMGAGFAVREWQDIRADQRSLKTVIIVWHSNEPGIRALDDVVWEAKWNTGASEPPCEYELRLYRKTMLYAIDLIHQGNPAEAAQTLEDVLNH